VNSGFVPFAVILEELYMVVEVIEGVVGLFSLLSTWRITACVAAGAVGVYVTTLVVEARAPRLVLCGVILLGAFWCGWRWQKAAEQRRRNVA
jgi:hypothetical protein